MMEMYKKKGQQNLRERTIQICSVFSLNSGFLVRTSRINTTNHTRLLDCTISNR